MFLFVDTFLGIDSHLRCALTWRRSTRHPKWVAELSTDVFRQCVVRVDLEVQKLYGTSAHLSRLTHFTSISSSHAWPIDYHAFLAKIITYLSETLYLNINHSRSWLVSYNQSAIIIRSLIQASHALHLSGLTAMLFESMQMPSSYLSAYPMIRCMRNELRLAMSSCNL